MTIFTYCIFSVPLRLDAKALGEILDPFELVMVSIRFGCVLLLLLVVVVVVVGVIFLVSDSMNETFAGLDDADLIGDCVLDGIATSVILLSRDVDVDSGGEDDDEYEEDDDESAERDTVVN